MEFRQPMNNDAANWAEALIHSRRTTLPKRLSGPGPDAGQRLKILSAAAAAPDHDQLLPWRFVEIPTDQRQRLASAFAQALLERDPLADNKALDMAQEKAHRAPWLLLAVWKKSAGNSLESTDDVPNAERLLSCGAAIQNMLLQATAMGLGTSLTSGKALASTAMRTLFHLGPQEEAVCFINIGHVTESPRRTRVRPAIEAFFSRL